MASVCGRLSCAYLHEQRGGTRSILARLGAALSWLLTALFLALFAWLYYRVYGLAWLQRESSFGLRSKRPVGKWIVKV